MAEAAAPADRAPVDFLPVAISEGPQRNASSDQADVEKPGSSPLALSLAIGLRGGGTLPVPSSLSSSETTRLIAAIEAAPEATS